MTMALLKKGTWWRLAYTGPLADNWAGVAVAAQRTILVGENVPNSLLSFIPGANLEDIPVPLFPISQSWGDGLTSIAYIPTLGVDEMVLVGENGRYSWSVNQGANWNTAAFAGNPDMRDIAGVSGQPTQFVAVASNVVWGRDSLGTWSTRWTGTRPWGGVAYRAGAGWVVVGTDGYAMHSPSGLNGTFGTPYVVTTGAMGRVRANDSYFIATDTSAGIWRSSTGLSGSWTDISLGGSHVFLVAMPMAADNEWVVFDYTGQWWYTSDNGDNWTLGDLALDFGVIAVGVDATYAVCATLNGKIYVSYDLEQEDHTPVDAPAPDAAFGANDDMAGDAVRRLVTQFRSGS